MSKKREFRVAGKGTEEGAGKRVKRVKSGEAGIEKRKKGEARQLPIHSDRPLGEDGDRMVKE